MYKSILSVVIFFSAHTLLAQLPETQIYMFNVQRSLKKYKISQPKLISFKEGYNNQPFFSQDGQSVLFCSNNGRSTTDIYAYDINKNKTRRLTRTSEAEYSPRYTPDGENISCVRVEDDTVTQNFVLYNIKGKKSKLPIPKLTTIGYYSWINATDIAAFVLSKPDVLMRYNTYHGTQDTLAKNIGRSVVTLRGKIYYADKSDSNNVVIRVVSKEKLMHKKGASPSNYEYYTDPIIIPAIKGEEDFCVMTDGTFLMGHEGKLFAFHPRKNKTWVEVVNLNDYGIKQFYRLAASPDNTKVAIVAFVGNKP